MPYPIIAIRKLLSSKTAIALLAAAFLIFNGIWIWQYRSTEILDIDEAGYFGFAISDYHAWLSGGLPAWIQQVEAPSIQAPMTTALASLLFLLSGPSITAGFAIPLLAGAVSVVATYSLARCLSPAPTALLSAALVASCPLILNYSRSFHFAMPATAVTTLTLVCMLRSRHFSSRLWACLFGICLGLMPLARTMAIAFIPGIIIGAAVHLAAQRSDPWRRVGVFGASLMIAITTSLSWLLFNGQVVFDYLFSFGYGNRASEYGDKQSIFNINSWLSTVQLTLDYIHIPHALVLLAGVFSALYIAIRSFRRQGLGASANQLTRSSVLPLLIILLTGVAALTSSQNSGTAFIAPLMPLAFVAAVWLIRSSLSKPLIRASAAMIGSAICIIAAVPLADASSNLSYPWEVKLPGPGWWLKVTSGRGPIQHYEKGMLDAGRDAETPLLFSPSQPLPPSHERAYVALISSTSRELQADALGGNGVALGFRHYLFNANSLRLSGLFRGKEPPPLIQVEPMVTGDSIDDYYNWLTNSEAANVCLLLTLSSDREQPLPVVTKPFLLQAARKAGFSLSREWPTPSGQNIGLWKRTQGSKPCHKPVS